MVAADLDQRMGFKVPSKRDGRHCGLVEIHP
jgi:hypothetical protein